MLNTTLRSFLYHLHTILFLSIYLIWILLNKIELPIATWTIQLDCYLHPHTVQISLLFASNYHLIMFHHIRHHNCIFFKNILFKNILFKNILFKLWIIFQVSNSHFNIFYIQFLYLFHYLFNNLCYLNQN